MLLRQLRPRLLSQELWRQTTSFWQPSRNFSGDQGEYSSIRDPLDVNLLDAADQVVSISNAAETAAVAAAQADCWVGTRKIIDFLTYSHDALDLDWWAAIALSNTAVRMISFPITILTQQKTAGINEMKQHVDHMKDLYRSSAQATSAAEYERIRGLQRQAEEVLNTKYKSEKKWALLMPGIGFANVALLISQFSAVSQLAKEKLPSMTHEGLSWFTNLTVPDPVYGLPIACAALTLLMVETGAMGQEMNIAPQMQKTMKWVMRVLGLVVIPAGGYVSAAVGVLWVSNSVLSLVQGALLRNPATRKLLKLPDLKASSHVSSATLSKLTAIELSGSAAVLPPPPGMRPSRVVQGPRAGKKVIVR